MASGAGDGAVVTVADGDAEGATDSALGAGGEPVQPTTNAAVSTAAPLDIFVRAIMLWTVTH